MAFLARYDLVACYRRLDCLHYFISFIRGELFLHWIVVWRSPNRQRPYPMLGFQVQKSRHTSRGLGDIQARWVIRMVTFICQNSFLTVILPLLLNAAARFRGSFRSSPRPGESQRVLPSHLGASTSTGMAWFRSLASRTKIPPNCSLVSA